MCGCLGHVLRVFAQDLGLIEIAADDKQLLFNWKAVADLPWADAGVLPICGCCCCCFC